MLIFDVSSRVPASITELETSRVWLALFATKPNADGVGIEADFAGYERQEIRLARRSASGGGLLSADAIEFPPTGVGAQAVRYGMLVGSPAPEDGEVRIGWGRLLGDPVEWDNAGVRIPAGQLQLRV